MTRSDRPHVTSSLYNVQPTSNTSEPRVFPSLPYTTENLKFIKKFDFQFSDLTLKILLYVVFYSNIKLDMLHMKMMLEK